MIFGKFFALRKMKKSEGARTFLLILFLDLISEILTHAADRSEEYRNRINRNVCKLTECFEAEIPLVAYFAEAEDESVPCYNAVVGHYVAVM